MKRRFLLLIVPFGLVLMLVLSAGAIRSRAQAGDPYGLIDAVNGLRVSSGLPAYEINDTLMYIAQAHADYQASIGTVTHIGPGGTRPRDRAAAAGYGGGGTFFISENIAGGTNLSIDEVISWWLGDYDHIQTMLGPNYREIGAGVAEADGFVYYTIDAAYVAGGNYKPPATIPPGGPTAMPYYAVLTVTPSGDGSIVHTVRSGQNLTLIAKAYGLTVPELKALNNLTNDDIYVGDVLIIRLASTPGPTATDTATTTPTRAATATRKPTRTATRTPAPSITSEITPEDPAPKGASPLNSDQVGNILVITIISLAAGGVILMILGSFMKRKPAG